MRQLKQTRIRAFRLDSDLLEQLAKAARHAHKTENSLVSDVIADRLIVDPLFSAFEEISLRSNIFRAILDTSNPDLLEEIASQLAKKNVRLMYDLYESDGRNLDFWMLLTDLLENHGHWFHIEGEFIRNHRWTTLHHQYGPNWSRFLGAYLEGAYSIFSKEKLDVKIGEQSVRIRFANS